MTTTAARRIRKIQRSIDETRRNVRHVKDTGLCVICNQAPAYDIPDIGQKAMTCTRRQCKRAFLLYELSRCPRCKGLEFNRLAFQENERGAKLYECARCGVIADERRVVVETVADEEQNPDDVDGGTDE